MHHNVDKGHACDHDADVVPLCAQEMDQREEALLLLKHLYVIYKLVRVEEDREKERRREREKGKRREGEKEKVRKRRREQEKERKKEFGR